MLGSLGKCGLHGSGLRDCLMQRGRGASRTWPEVLTPSLAWIPLAQTRHCWGVRGADLQFPLGRPGADTGRSRRGGQARWPAPFVAAWCPALEPVSRLYSPAAPSLEREPALVTRQSREVVGRGKGCCLWSFYCPSVSLGSFGSLL